MSKFIKVAVIEQTGSSTEHRINSDSIESFKDGKIRLKHSIELNVLETADQIEAQLLRDDFVMAALPSFINTRVTVEQATRQAYIYADAMLKERSK